MKQFVTSCTGSSQTLTPTIDEKVKVYNTYANAVSCIACLADGEIVATKSDNTLDMDAVECMIDEKISCANTYQTGEQVTCATWIDGCPIYRYICPPTANGVANTWACVANISNIGTMIDAKLIFTPETSYGLRSVAVEHCDTCVRIYTTSGWTTANSSVIFEYTKTV